MHGPRTHGEAQILKAGFKGNRIEQGWRDLKIFKQKLTFQPGPDPSRTLCSGLCPYLWASPWNALPQVRPTGPSGRPPRRGHGARTSSGSQGHAVEGSTLARRGSRSCTPDLQRQPAVSRARRFPNVTFQSHSPTFGSWPSSPTSLHPFLGGKLSISQVAGLHVGEKETKRKKVFFI